MAYNTILRKSGGSVMMAIPPAVLALVDFQVDMPVGIRVEEGCLLVSATKTRRYRLKDLIAQCDLSAPLPPRDDAWEDMPAVGNEVL